MSVILEIQADKYSDDKSSAHVACPKCADEHKLIANSWIVNSDGMFRHNIWYGHSCKCGTDFCFMLEFEKTPLKIGGKYCIKKPAHSFGVIDGNLTNFPEKVYGIEVLNKPNPITVWDGEQETLEPLPEHLAQDDWYYVRDLNSGKTHWLNPKGCQVIAM